MKRRSLKLALSIAGCCVIAVVLLLSIDALIAVNRMNPVPAAEAAAAGAGWDIDMIHLQSFNASGGPFGSSAVVTYGLGEADDLELIEVHLRRPLFSSRWDAVTIVAR